MHAILGRDIKLAPRHSTALVVCKNAMPWIERRMNHDLRFIDILAKNAHICRNAANVVDVLGFKDHPVCSNIREGLAGGYITRAGGEPLM